MVKLAIHTVFLLLVDFNLTLVDLPVDSLCQYKNSFHAPGQSSRGASEINLAHSGVLAANPHARTHAWRDDSRLGISILPRNLSIYQSQIKSCKINSKVLKPTHTYQLQHLFKIPLP